MKKKNSIFIIPLLILGLLFQFACSSSSRESETNLSKPETGSFTDTRDGKIYKTVKIKDQWIMAENLAFEPDSGNFWVYNDDENNIAIYGYLYDWETAMNIAPEGWHLPSRDEWTWLIKALGAKRGTFPHLEIIYPKLIVGGSSGLDMLFGGMRTCKGKYRSLGDKARFWASTGGNRSGESEKTVYGLNKNTDGEPHGLNLSKAPFAYNNGFQPTCPGYNVRLFKD